jgi:predicted transcriptional regulator
MPEFTLRLTEEEIAALRQQAEREGRPTHEVVRLAIQERIARQDHNERVHLAARRVAVEHGEILERPGDA